MVRNPWILALLLGTICWLASGACILPGDQPALGVGDDDAADDDVSDDDVADDDVADDDDDAADDDAADDDAADDDDDTVPQDDTIQEIQQGGVPDGTIVDLRDVVVTTPIAASPRGFFVQEPVYATQAEFSGIWVYLPEASMVDDLAGVVTPDAMVNVRGMYTEYMDLSEIEINAASDVTPAGSHELLPAIVDPCRVATGGNQQEHYEGVLVRVEGVEVSNTNPDGPDNDWGEWEVDNCLRIDDLFHHVEPGESSEYAYIIGVMNYTHENAKLEPRMGADLDEIH
jgi:hypothetical protein